MDVLYYLWNAANGGWLTKNGQYSSDLEQAAEFSSAEALTRCRRTFNAVTREHGLIPVRIGDIQGVMA